jgi:SpoVK/Ycf46/Vps4 family AAA+-type ATPase
VSGSELVQKYIGEGSRMVRELFVMAREHAPSIIFMDEIDSIGSSRLGGGSGGGYGTIVLSALGSSKLGIDCDLLKQISYGITILNVNVVVLVT